jgi:hypothetical protein
MLHPGAPAKPSYEAFHLLGSRGTPAVSALLRRRALIAAFDLDNDVESVLKLLQKYAEGL